MKVEIGVILKKNTTLSELFQKTIGEEIFFVK